MSKVLVTGLLGMIGSWVGDQLIRNGHEVCGLDDCSGGNYDNLPKAACCYRGSVCDWATVESYFVHQKPEYVIHCAAMAAENLSHHCRAFTVYNNLFGESMIRNACINHGVKCMVSLSSIAVMGHETPPFNDDSQPHPREMYGICKYAGELDASAAHDFHGLNYCVVRPHNCLGIRQNYSDRFRNCAAIFVRQALENKPMTIFGDGSQTRAFSPVSYVSQIIAEIVDRPDVWNQTFNVGSDHVMTVLSLAKLICKLVGVKEDFHFLPARKEAAHAHMIHTICRKHFSHVPEPALNEVLSSMIIEALGKGFSPMQKGPEIEVLKGLPESWKT